MCERTKTALEIISSSKSTKSLSRREQVMLFQKVIEDSEKMGVRMTNLEKRMESVENKLDVGFAELKALIEKNKPLTLFDKIIALQSHKMFWITIIVALLVFGALFGIPISGFHGILTLGG